MIHLSRRRRRGWSAIASEAQIGSNNKVVAEKRSHVGLPSSVRSRMRGQYAPYLYILTCRNSVPSAIKCMPVDVECLWYWVEPYIICVWKNSREDEAIRATVRIVRKTCVYLHAFLLNPIEFLSSTTTNNSYRLRTRSKLRVLHWCNISQYLQLTCQLVTHWRSRKMLCTVSIRSVAQRKVRSDLHDVASMVRKNVERTSQYVL
jgi:hypothetical protein